MPVPNLPLRGDGHGAYRIHVVGNSGTGKSTLGAYLSGKLNIPHVPLDTVAWKPGWEKTPNDEFKEAIRTFMAQNTQGWVIDGNYRVLGTLVPDEATDIIWLDPPLHYYLPRLLLRTLWRLLGFIPSCAEGCQETWGEVFSTKGIVWFCVTNHAVTRTKYTAWLLRMGVATGGKMRRLDESRGDLTAWKDELEHHLQQTSDHRGWDYVGCKQCPSPVEELGAILNEVDFFFT